MVQRSDFSPAKIQGASGVALLSERIGGGQRGWVCSLLMEVGVFGFLMSLREEEGWRVPVPTGPTPNPSDTSSRLGMFSLENRSQKEKGGCFLWRTG